MGRNNPERLTFGSHPVLAAVCWMPGASAQPWMRRLPADAVNPPSRSRYSVMHRARRDKDRRLLWYRTRWWFGGPTEPGSRIPYFKHDPPTPHARDPGPRTRVCIRPRLGLPPAAPFSKLCRSPNRPGLREGPGLTRWATRANLPDLVDQIYAPVACSQVVFGTAADTRLACSRYRDWKSIIYTEP